MTPTGRRPGEPLAAQDLKAEPGIPGDIKERGRGAEEMAVDIVPGNPAGILFLLNPQVSVADHIASFNTTSWPRLADSTNSGILSKFM